MLALLLMAGGCSKTASVIPPIAGIVWQPDNATLHPHGAWHKLGASELLVQWMAVDGEAFVETRLMPTQPVLPDWQRIGAEPWAREVIMGLAGRFDEKAARADFPALIAASAALARQPLLATLPRPLWISVYDRANLGPEVLVLGLKQWLPADVGLFFQDGVGVHAREARVARHYANVLSREFGKKRVRIIAEAFRPKPGGGFRSATIDELAPQLARYKGYRIYLFDGPHYLDDALVAQIAARQAGAGAAAP